MRARILSIIAIIAVVATTLVPLSGDVPIFADDVPVHNWTISGNTVYIDDAHAYLSANPHTITSSGWVTFTLISKGYEGDIDVVWGIQGDDNIKFSNPQVWRQNVAHTVIVDVPVEKYGSRVLGNITGYEKLTPGSREPDLGNTNNPKLLQLNFTNRDPMIVAWDTRNIIDNSTVQFNYYYDTVNKVPTTEYWPDWRDLEWDFTKTSYNYSGADTWFSGAFDVPIMSGINYTVRAWVTVPIKLGYFECKYIWGVKPSSETFAQARDNGHLYVLDPWLAGGWLYRREITINEAAGAGTNYQVLFIVDEDGGGGGDFDLGGNCTDFPNDITWTDNDGDTELDHWLEEEHAGAPGNATFWVEVKDDLTGAGTETCYIYFGKAGQASSSNGANTFPLGFDDFERGVDMDEVGNGWIEYQGNIEISTDHAYGGTRSMQILGNSTTVAMGNRSLTHDTGYAIRSRWYHQDLSRSYWFHGDGTEQVFMRQTTENNTQVRNGGWTTMCHPPADCWQLLEFNDFSWAAHTYDVVINGTKQADNQDMYNSAQSDDYFSVRGGLDGEEWWVDDYVVRKFVDPEPSFNSAGATEQPFAPPTVVTFNATAVTNGTAFLSGNVTSLNDTQINYRGFAWDTSSHGLPDMDTKPAAGGYGTNWSEADAFPVGIFNVTANFTTATTYYLRAFAQNDDGKWGYGAEITFLTLPNPPTNVNATDCVSTSNVTVNWTLSSGNVTGYYIIRDGVLIQTVGNTTTEYEDTGAAAPNITAGTATASDGTSNYNVTVQAAGISSNNGSTSTYWVIAYNSAGNSTNSTTDTGFRCASALSYQWLWSADNVTYNVLAGATTLTHNDTTAVAGNITPGTASATDGSSTTEITLSIAGEGTTQGRTRYYKMRTSMADADTVNSTEDTGYRGIGGITYQWYRSAGDADAGYGVLGGATTDPYSDTSAPAPTINGWNATATDGASNDHVTLSANETVTDGAGRWYYCTLSADGAANNDTNHNRGYRGTTTLTYQWYYSEDDIVYNTLAGATTDPYNDSTAVAGNITPGTASATDGTSSTETTLSIAGEGTTVGRTRYYLVEVSMVGATSANSTNDTGYRGIGAITYQWYRSAGDADGGYGSLGGATTDPYSDTGAPAPTITPNNATASDGTSISNVTVTCNETVTDGDGRWYYCLLSADGAANNDTNHNRGYRGTVALTYQWYNSTNGITFAPLAGATTDPYQDTTAPAGNVTAGTVTASDGTSGTEVTLSLAGESANNGSIMYYLCEVSMVGAASANSTNDTGYRLCENLTYQWYRSAGDADAGYGILAGATTDPYSDTSAPAPSITAWNATASNGTQNSYITVSANETTSDGAGRWYLCEVDATGAVAVNTTGNRGYRGTSALSYQWYYCDDNINWNTLVGGTTDPYNDATAWAGNITPGTASATDGASSTEVTLSIAGEDTTIGRNRTYLVEISMSGATTVNTTNSTGWRGIGAITYQWYRSAADGDAGYGILAGATSDPHSDTDAPNPTITPNAATATDGTSTLNITLSANEGVSNGDGRWYYCRLSADGASNNDTTHNRGYKGTAALSYQWYNSTDDITFNPMAGAVTDPYIEAGAPAGNITVGTVTASDGSSTTQILLAVVGASANNGSTRYYLCEISMAGADTKNTTSDDGWRGVGNLTYQWYRSAADADAGYAVLAGATNVSHNDTTAPAPIITANNATASNGTSMFFVELSANETVADGDGRWYLCELASNGTTTSNTTGNRGYRGTTTLAYQWYRSWADVAANYSAIAGGTTDPYNDTGGAVTPDGRYYLCNISMVGAVSVNTSADRGWMLPFTALYPPTNFTATRIDLTSCNLTWTKGLGSNTTVIYSSGVDYPTTFGDGYLTYNDTGNWTLVTGLDLDFNTYYWSAWGVNASAAITVSVNHTTTSLGGEGMIEIMGLGLFALLGFGMMIGFFWKKSPIFGYGAAGIWALAAFMAFQRSTSPSPAQITDVWMGFFWLGIVFTIACALLPTLMREKPESGEVFADDTDAVGDDVSSIVPEQKPVEHRPKLYRLSNRPGVVRTNSKRG